MIEAFVFVFAEHSKNPACYNCHKTLDPLAILLDYYNTVGLTNNSYSYSTVELNKTKIENLTDLKKYLIGFQEATARSFCKALLKYMLGRDLSIPDENKVDRIIQKTAINGFKAGDIYTEIIGEYFIK